MLDQKIDELVDRWNQHTKTDWGKADAWRKSQVAKRAVLLTERIGAVGKPPAEDEDGDGHTKSPPEGEEKVSCKAKKDKSHPENLALHGRSLP